MAGPAAAGTPCLETHSAGVPWVFDGDGRILGVGDCAPHDATRDATPSATVGVLQPR